MSFRRGFAEKLKLLVKAGLEPTKENTKYLDSKQYKRKKML